MMWFQQTEHLSLHTERDNSSGCASHSRTLLSAWPTSVFSQETQQRGLQSCENTPRIRLPQRTPTGTFSGSSIPSPHVSLLLLKGQEQDFSKWSFSHEQGWGRGDMLKSLSWDIIRHTLQENRHLSGSCEGSQGQAPGPGLSSAQEATLKVPLKHEVWAQQHRALSRISWSGRGS